MATGRGRTVEAEAPSKKPTVIHEKFAEFIEAETNVKVSPRSVMLVLTMNGAYRDSDEYAEAIEIVEAGRASKAQDKVDARNARIKARADKIRAQLEAVEAELGDDGDDEDEAPAPRRGRPAKTVAAPARRSAGRAAKAPAKATTRRTARATTEEDVETPAPRRRGRPRKAAASPTPKRGNLRSVEAPVVEDPEDVGVNAPDVEDY